MTDEKKNRAILADVCARLYERKLTFSSGGNVSMRNADGVLITPSGRNKGRLKPEEMVKTDIGGKLQGEGKPSIELGFHLAIYDCRPEVNAVVHCHPLYCTALAVKKDKLRTGLTPEGILLLGDVPHMPYATPGTQDLVDIVAEYSKHHDAMIMERHGAITLGRDLEEAYNRMEELEFQAHMQFLTEGSLELPEEERRRIRNGL